MKKETGQENLFKETRRKYNETHDEEITLQFLADKLNLDKSSLSKLETGKISPTLEHVRVYHEVFDVSMEYLIGECIAEKYENIRVSEELGITDAVADTMSFVKEHSNESNNISAILNAFIGNGKATHDFLSTLLTYMYMEHTEGDNKNPVLETLMTTSIIKYLNNHVRPQLKSVLDAKKKTDELLSDYAYFNDDYKQIQSMIEDCYQHHSSGTMEK